MRKWEKTIFSFHTRMRRKKRKNRILEFSICLSWVFYIEFIGQNYWDDQISNFSIIYIFSRKNRKSEKTIFTLPSVVGRILLRNNHHVKTCDNMLFFVFSFFRFIYIIAKKRKNGKSKFIWYPLFYDLRTFKNFASWHPRSVCSR